jgi:hypothetical protein
VWSRATHPRRASTTKKFGRYVSKLASPRPDRYNDHHISRRTGFWLAPFSCRCRNWMVHGCILRACHWALDGTAIVPPLAMKGPCLPTRSCTNSATSGMPRSVHACRPSENAMQYVFRLPATTAPGCSCGLYARLAIARQPMAPWNTTSSGVSGPRRMPTCASRRWRNVTFRPICSGGFNPSRPSQP